MIDRLRVLLADDHAVVRSGLQHLVELTDRYKVVGHADTGERAVERAASLRPDVVVMDIRMPGLDGIAATRRIAALDDSIPVLILSAYDDPEYIEAAVSAGARGFLSKRRARSDLIAALDMLTCGRVSFPIHVSRMLSPSRGRRKERDALAILTDREREVLLLAAAGYTAKEIADRFGLAPKTIGNFKMAVRRKLNLQTRSDLLRIVVESGHLGDMLEMAGFSEDRTG